MTNVSDKDAIIVGESNPFGGDPGYALWPEPEECSGGRLMRHLGMSRHDYVRTRRVNLCRGAWSLTRARDHAKLLIADETLAHYVLLGRKVQQAFGFEKADLFSLATFTSWRKGNPVLRFYILPHPSGRCLAWNVRAADIRARKLLRGVLPVMTQPPGTETR